MGSACGQRGRGHLSDTGHPLAPWSQSLALEHIHWPNTDREDRPDQLLYQSASGPAAGPDVAPFAGPRVLSAWEHVSGRAPKHRRAHASVVLCPAQKYPLPASSSDISAGSSRLKRMRRWCLPHFNLNIQILSLLLHPSR